MIEWFRQRAYRHGIEDGRLDGFYGFVVSPSRHWFWFRGTYLRAHKQGCAEARAIK